FLLCPWGKRRENKRVKEIRELLTATPYCPQHNRIERVWRDLHANVRSPVFRNSVPAVCRN
ncbi:MAG: hypothetical protein P8J37_17030, partial [Fuerstiella sp.]|nr:hypothetical protein [Fuerstiella sp.]